MLVRNTSFWGRWWWTVDRLTLGATALLMLIGFFLLFAASPSVAEKIRLHSFFFVHRQLVLLPLAILSLLFFSCLPLKRLKQICFLLYFLFLGVLLLTLVMGVDIKGARRWISLGGFSLQISEFLKPVFVVVMGSLLTDPKIHRRYPYIGEAMGPFFISFSFLLFPLVLIILQPDLGMSIILTLTWLMQLFVCGLSWVVIGMLFGFVVVGGGLAYLFLPHVTQRVDQFLHTNPKDMQSDFYQVYQSLEAFKKGGFWGVGPGEGVVKRNIPDAHADFIFSVAGEEFGLILCLAIVGIVLFITIRSIFRGLDSHNIFVMCASTGLAVQFSLQAFINIASTLHLIPTKGMTLPLVSYGGSSLIASGICMGILLSLTRKYHGEVRHVR